MLNWWHCSYSRDRGWFTDSFITFISVAWNLIWKYQVIKWPRNTRKKSGNIKKNKHILEANKMKVLRKIVNKTKIE